MENETRNGSAWPRAEDVCFSAQNGPDTVADAPCTQSAIPPTSVPPQGKRHDDSPPRSARRCASMRMLVFRRAIAPRQTQTCMRSLQGALPTARTALFTENTMPYFPVEIGVGQRERSRVPSAISSRPPTSWSDSERIPGPRSDCAVAVGEPAEISEWPAPR
ncbi:hypothetical protein FA95DRAFT_645209 [Auriscalpium vulgare]|uniref:Uncharacterized protein n=1 Tax=Auriscalpium vulgare TaxID=40419 RepID=A0ACB8S1Z5_9AGAM|nr:hypothetical protein FA95DRAFT_645209 [Auriscalpium vulgare]